MSFFYIPDDDTAPWVAQLQDSTQTSHLYPRLAAFLPNFAGTWIDSWVFGCSVVLFVVWWKRARVHESRLAASTLCAMFIASIVLTAWNLTYLLYTFAGGYARYDTLTLNTLWPKWYGLFCLAIRTPASTKLTTWIYFLHRAYTLNGNLKWLLGVGATLILGMVCAGIAHTAMLASAPTSPAIRACSLISAGCGVLADLVSSGMIARSWYRPSENRVVVKEHRVLRAAFSAAETQAPAVIAGLIILILTLASCVTPPRVLLCHPKLSLICMLLTMKRQTAIRRATAGALGLDGSYGSHSQSASVSFGHKATMATMGHGHGGLSQVRTLAPIDFGATGENKHQQQQGQEQGQGQGQGHQQATLARSPRTPLVPRFGHPKDLSSFPSPSGTAGPGAFSRRKPPPTACSFESAMLQETEAPFVAYADAASASASAYTNPSNVNSVDTLPLEMRDKDHTGPMLESKQSPGFDRMTNGSIVSNVGEGGEDEKGQVGESQVALVHAH